MNEDNKHKHESKSIAIERTLINALMDNISDNIYFKDIESRFIRINKALALYFNLSDPIEAIGMTDFDFFSEEHARQAFKDEQKILKTGQCISREEKETWKNRPDSWVSTVKMPLRDENGKIIGTFGISRNITNLIEAEFALKEKNEELYQLNEELSDARIKAETSDRLKTAFLQNINHEIRTPLNAIVGFSNLMIEQYNNKPILEDYAQNINQHCFDLLGMINDILSIAKIESGLLPVNIEKFNLVQVLSEILIFFKEYQSSLKKQHIEFNYKIDGDPSDLIITSDKTKFKQIFIYLINNAFKFTDKGKIQFGCKLTEHNQFQFFVSDTGIGIPPDKEAYIFERFAQVDRGNERLYRGTGLGLCIAKGLVDLLEGKIWFESKPKIGSTFYFSLPNEDKNNP